MNLDNALLVEELPSYCIKLNIGINTFKLEDSLHKLLRRLGYTYDEFINKGIEDSLDFQKVENIAWPMYLNHLPGLIGEDRWAKYRGTATSLPNVDRINFSVFLTELEGLYLKDVIDNLRNYYKIQYNKEFKGTVMVVWLAPQKYYGLHFDNKFNGVRYHVPIITNNKAMWLLKTNENIYKLHMPYGTVWEFWPQKIEHTVFNNGDVARAHLILTEILDV